MTMPTWDAASAVSCSAPLPAASCGAAEPHARIDVVGVDDVPAVKHASPNASQAPAVVALELKLSLTNVVTAADDNTWAVAA